MTCRRQDNTRKGGIEMNHDECCETNRNDPPTPSEIVVSLLAASWVALGPIVALKVGGVL